MSLENLLPVVRAWFEQRLGRPTRAQELGWPAIRSGRDVLIAAPTGTGKTLAAFLIELDALLRQGDELGDRTSVLYVSPLRALSNDVQKNLLGPLAEIRALDPTLPELRVLVRTGDTPPKERAAMVKKRPHVLVTTPESLYILLTSKSGRAMLGGVRTVIVDEIHALARDKRGSHLALSLERLHELAGGPQRIGLSATQKPLEAMARLLAGEGRDCAIVDAGHLRELELEVLLPDSPLSAVCSHEQWNDLYRQIAELARAHKSTLVFVNTRKLAEQLAARLAAELGRERVGCHHGSLARETRLEAEERLKRGELAVLVATASLELGIDIGDVDLVVQIASPRSIATLLQRVGRAGHGVDRRPKGRLVPLTRDEAVEAAALLRALRAGLLDRTPEPPYALDILAQQVVAECVAAPSEEGVLEEQLFALFRRAAPFAQLSREDFEQVLELHAKGREALLHRDRVNGRVRATRRARLAAITSGGAIPDNADYRVLQEPGELFVGTVNEDFAIEASRGDVFQLGNTSWQVLKVEPGLLRVADAEGAPPSLPFWLGEAPARSRELSAEVSRLREECSGAEWVERECGGGPALAREVADYLAEGRRQLGAMPTQGRIVAERFFDESGGMQVVVHAPFGSRVNKALGLALRKRICRGFGFELQAAAVEEAIVLSLGPQSGFELEELFDWLRPASGREVLEQALLAAPFFQARWRWNAQRALVLPRMLGGKRVPPPVQRMRADDLLARAFPEVLACGENLPPGDLPIPREHPLVRQTIEDCLHEALDVDGFLALLEGLTSGAIERVAVETSEPSAFARGVLNARPYAFLDDAPLEERRTQAVLRRRTLEPREMDELGALDPAAIARVREEAWPSPASAEEVHEALCWMGYVEASEAPGWSAWLEELASAGRVVREGERWYAVEASRAPLEVLRGRFEALGPVRADHPMLEGLGAELLALEAEGAVLRMRLDGRPAWCARRLLARIHRLTLEGLRRAIQPVSIADFLRFVVHWQRAEPSARAEGPRGLLDVLRQLAGFQAPAAEWERSILPARVAGYRSAWLDELGAGGEIAWGRLFGSSALPARKAPIAFVPREELGRWLALGERPSASELRGDVAAVLEALEHRGASFFGELASTARVLPSRLEEILAELAARGLVTCDAFAGLRRMFRRPHSRHSRRGAHEPPPPVGRWSILRARALEPSARASGEEDLEALARRLLERYGLLFKHLLAREALPVRWRELWRCLRRMELRGEVHGGRFVAGLAGEQFALPAAVERLRALRSLPEGEPVNLSTADPAQLAPLLAPSPPLALPAI